MSERVMVTEAAHDQIVQLKVRYGSLIFMQSEVAVRAALRCACKRATCSLVQSRGVRSMIDREQYERWRRPTFLIDVSQGGGDTFSLEGPQGMHFVARTGGNEESVSHGIL